jgi:hypothetical protein
VIKKVALAFAGVVVAGGACLAIAVLLHVHRQVASDAEAAAAFDGIRVRFVNASPLLSVDDQLQLVVRRDTHAPGEPIAALHALSYSPQSQKLVRADFPRWLLRIVTVDGRVRLVNIDIIQKNGERLTLDDLDRHGPGVIFDARLPTRRMLLWTE